MGAPAEADVFRVSTDDFSHRARPDLFLVVGGAFDSDRDIPRVIDPARAKEVGAFSADIAIRQGDTPGGVDQFRDRLHDAHPDLDARAKGYRTSGNM